MYLNPSWDASTNGGELVVHETDASSGQPTGAAAQVPPSAGRLALFWSDRVPHEVKRRKACTRCSINIAIRT